MFDEVAARYDRTNDVLSLGQDRRWRRAVARGARPAARASGCSTWPPAPARRREPFADAGVRAVPVRLLPRDAPGRASGRRPDLPFVAGDATRLPFADGAFDAVTISFGLRNVGDTGAGARARCAGSPGPAAGSWSASSATRPGRRCGTVYTEYLMRALPAVARRGLSSPGRLRLPRRVDPRLARPAGLGELMTAAGWGEVAYRNLSGGIVALHRAVRP